MRYALIDNYRVEAQPKLHGLCPNCFQPVVAKCGKHKIWHWAHRSITSCDSWWEPETEWHRNWKNNYPANWQEISLLDKRTGEKHISDVLTTHDLTIEFQHSAINPEERISREKFYKNMVWIVDGTRLKRDYPRFLKGRKNSFENTIFHKTDNPYIFRVDLIDWCLPSAWLESSVPVIFDFLGLGTLDDEEGLRIPLYCLFPQVGQYARIAEISRKAFINSTINGDWASRVEAFIDSFKKQDALKRQEQQQTAYHSSNTKSYRWNGIPITRKEYLKRFYKSRR